MAQKLSPKPSGEHIRPQIDLTTSDVRKATPTTQSSSRLPIVSGTIPPPSAAPLGVKSAVDVTPTTLFTSPEPFVHDALMEVDSNPQIGLSNSVSMQNNATSSLATPAINVGPGNQANTRGTSVVQPLVGQPGSIEGVKLLSHLSPLQPTVSRGVVIQPQEKAATPTSQPGTMSMDIDNHEQSQHLPLQVAERDQSAMNVDVVDPTNAHTSTSGAKDAEVQLTESPSLQVQQEILALPGRDNIRASSSMSISSRQPSVSLGKGAVEQADSVSIEDQGYHPEHHATADQSTGTCSLSP